MISPLNLSLTPTFPCNIFHLGPPSGSQTKKLLCCLLPNSPPTPSLSRPGDLHIPPQSSYHFFPPMTEPPRASPTLHPCSAHTSHISASCPAQSQGPFTHIYTELPTSQHPSPSLASQDSYQLPSLFL